MNTFLSYLLEKDHRNKMEKFGIPEEVANYLHDFNDKYSLWFAKVFNTDPDFQSAPDKVQWVANKTSDMGDIMDWVIDPRSGNIQLNGYSWKSALSAVAEFKNNPDRVMFLLKERNTIIKEYDDGTYWVDLETSDSVEEKKLMKHCGKTTAETMLSLRSYDPESNTLTGYVTIAANLDDSWQQAKGYDNTVPDETLHGKIAHILVDNYMLTYKHEQGNDFNAEDLQEYIETHRDEFKDPDDLIENIDSNLTKFEEFEKVLADADLTNINIDIEESYDEERYVYMTGGIYEDITFEALGIDYVDFDKISGEYTEICDRIETLLGVTFEAFTLENSYNSKDSLIMRGDFNMDSDSIFNMDEYGLESFENALSHYEFCQNSYDSDEIINIINYGLAADRIIETEYTKFVDDIIDVVENYEGSIDLTAEETPIDDGVSQAEIASALASTPLQKFIDNDPLFDGYISNRVLYDNQIPNSIDRTIHDLKVLGNPLYHLYKYLKDSLVGFNDIIVMYEYGILNFKYEFNSNELDNIEEYNKAMKIVNYFIKNIQSIQSEVEELINDKIVPFIDITRYMDISDVTYTLTGISPRRGFVIIRPHDSKLTIGRVPLGLSVTHKDFEDYDLKKDKVEIEGLISRHLKSSEFKKYPKGDDYNPKQTLMTFEAYCNR